MTDAAFDAQVDQWELEYDLEELRIEVAAQGEELRLRCQEGIARGRPGGLLTAAFVQEGARLAQRYRHLRRRLGEAAL